MWFCKFAVDSATGSFSASDVLLDFIVNPLTKSSQKKLVYKRERVDMHVRVERNIAMSGNAKQKERGRH